MAGRSENDDTPRPITGWTWIIMAAGLSTTMGSSLSVGYNIGVINSPSTIIKSFSNTSIYERYNLILNDQQLDILWSMIVSIFIIGGTIGSFGGSWLADGIGRRGSLIISSIIFIIAGLLFFLTKLWNLMELLLIGRFLAGIGSGLVTSVMPMYLTELASVDIRGSIGVLCPLGVTFGVLIGQILSLHRLLGDDNHWHLLLAFYTLPLIVCSAILPFLPESPKYLYVIKNEPRLAIKQLIRLRGVEKSNLESEINELNLEKIVNHNMNDWNFMKIICDKSLLLPILLVCSLQGGQQFSGINSIFYYSVRIFSKTGLSLENSQLATIGAGFCNFFMAIVSIHTMSKYDRRHLLEISLITTTFFLTLLGLAITFISITNWMPYISIVGVLGFVVCYGIALGPVPYFIGSELFEVGPRPYGMAMGSMANWAGNFIVGQFFPVMQHHIGAGSFFIFAIIVMALYIFIKIYLPETRGRDVVEIAGLCKRGFASKPLHSPIDSDETMESLEIDQIKDL